MNFRDRAIIIYKSLLKERASVVTVFTENYGLYSGVVRSTGKKGDGAALEGNLVDFAWQARLHEHLGTAKIDPVKSYNGRIIGNKMKLYAFNSAVSIIRKAFHEREPHNNLFPSFLAFVELLSSQFDFANYIKLELAILHEAGYGLQLDKCAATGGNQELCYVSPKSGRAVSREAGRPYADKMLKLPAFLNDGSEPDATQIHDAAKLTEYFLKRYVFFQGSTPNPRQVLIANLLV